MTEFSPLNFKMCNFFPGICALQFLHFSIECHKQSKTFYSSVDGAESSRATEVAGESAG